MTLYLDRHGKGSIYPPTKPSTPRGVLFGVRYFVEPRGKMFAVVEKVIDRALYVDCERDVEVCSSEIVAEQLARRLGGVA